jgi:hypothetical protein
MREKRAGSAAGSAAPSADASVRSDATQVQNEGTTARRLDLVRRELWLAAQHDAFSVAMLTRTLDRLERLS